MKIPSFLKRTSSRQVDRPAIDKPSLGEVRRELLKRGFRAPTSAKSYFDRSQWTAWNLSKASREVFEAVLKLLDIVQEYKDGAGRFAGRGSDGKRKGLGYEGRVFDLLLPEEIQLEASQVREITASPQAIAEICGPGVFLVDKILLNLPNLPWFYQTYVVEQADRA